MIQWKKVTILGQDKEDVAMLKVAICDDEEYMVDKIEWIVVRKFCKRPNHFRASTVRNGNAYEEFFCPFLQAR